ncbi:1-deoxy-D-xylulose-5-phosphate reductoisomerase [Flavonifractor sp. An10]|uniref:1-deoxy-D-xylulose-5-phosphate reductoisomerase n=1 Tax=Flavonifractor sp. An10 TaxID=1965537 RepID=UPI000B366817|nr:1-deoxy-D-xylulose-5-phosphate reductoisomerase [Flavonifractor sp. An10]OUQ84707.1 1-deoxy-D-xylulose-5-phosphate reductoisomerase [Flavonifractor sp. An10]
MEEKRCISLLGSTGSIGRQALEVIAAEDMAVAALTANRDVDRLEEQCRRFRPALAVMMDPAAASDLRVRLADTGIRVAAGMDGLLEAAVLPQADTVLTAVVGIVGLRPTLAAVEAGKRIALANKETLVCGGELVMDGAARSGAEIVPVDSEHSALFQCLQGCRDRGGVRRLILTASGGPFWGWTAEQLDRVTVEQALAHPNWSMGAKISVDSATMMNKGLEFIEAMRLYRMPPEKISIVIHRESIIHSLVEYSDHAILAQLGAPDMRLPIQYALTWPRRSEGVAKPLDLLTCPPLTFHAPDCEAFPCLRLALEAARTGGTATAVLNGANEAAVGQFLAGKLSFAGIAQKVEEALAAIPAIQSPVLEEILAADEAARALVNR